MPGSAQVARSFSTTTGSVPFFGSGPPSAAFSDSRAAMPPTWRDATSSRYFAAIAWAVSRTARCIVLGLRSPGEGGLPDRDEWKIPRRGPLLPFDRGFGGEDCARIVAIRQSQSFVESRTKVRFERGHRDRAVTRRVDA